MKLAIFILILLSTTAYGQDNAKCYVVYTDTKDRLITGCPVEGYHMNYQMAHGTVVNMFLFRNDEDERGQVSVYFAVFYPGLRQQDT